MKIRLIDDRDSPRTIGEINCGDFFLYDNRVCYAVRNATEDLSYVVLNTNRVYSFDSMSQTLFQGKLKLVREPVFERK